MQVFFGFRLIRITLVITGFISWGAFGGFAVSMGIIAVSHPHMSTVGQYILLAFLVLFGAAIATFYERYSIIVGTSCGGAFMFMYGVDEIVQVGYREMIVIFEFEGKTLMYHTNPKVIVMIGCSLALALLGIAWEFWHHEKPLWLNQRALFRIYGRPFGKRPEKLAGQRIKEMDWYNYLMGCLCLRRKTAEEVLYEDFDDDLPKKTKKEEEQHQVTVEVAEEEMVVVEDGFVVMVSDLEAAAVISGQDSKTMISGTDQEDASEKPMSLSGLAPVQVVVEEIEYELEDGDGKVVSVEAFSETIVQTNREGTVSEAMYISSTTRTEQQQHTTTSSVSATTTAISSSHAASSIMTTTTYIAESESTPEPL
ncbi:hypothetical protein BGX31_000070 [Mortierella sp. GBA43]|nr:hypothetical protein BGX31_000070 [Mortierella sp. GBA43]